MSSLQDKYKKLKQMEKSGSRRQHTAKTEAKPTNNAENLAKMAEIWKKKKAELAEQRALAPPSPVEEAREKPRKRQKMAPNVVVEDPVFAKERDSGSSRPKEAIEPPHEPRTHRWNDLDAVRDDDVYGLSESAVQPSDDVADNVSDVPVAPADEEYDPAAAIAVDVDATPQALSYGFDDLSE